MFPASVPRHVAPFPWLRWVVPGGILTVGVWWLLTDVLHVVGGV